MVATYSTVVRFVWVAQLMMTTMSYMEIYRMLIMILLS